MTKITTTTIMKMMTHRVIAKSHTTSQIVKKIQGHHYDQIIVLERTKKDTANVFYSTRERNDSILTVHKRVKELLQIRSRRLRPGTDGHGFTVKVVSGRTRLVDVRSLCLQNKTVQCMFKGEVHPI